MIRLAADMVELQGLAAAQAQRQQPATGIASQWSAAHAGMGPSPLGPLAQANPLSGGLGGGSLSPVATPRAVQPQVSNDAEEVEADTSPGWEEQTAGALTGGMSGAVLGAKLGTVVPGIGNVVGAIGGGAIGALGGWLGARE